MPAQASAAVPAPQAASPGLSEPTAPSPVKRPRRRGGFRPPSPGRSSGCGPAPLRAPNPSVPRGLRGRGAAPHGERGPARPGCWVPPPHPVPGPLPGPGPRKPGRGQFARSLCRREGKWGGGQRLAPPASPLRPRSGRSPRRAGLGAAARAEVRFPPLFALTAAKSGRKTPRLR